MTKLDRIISLLNLLGHRKQVSMMTIKAICNMPERTIYRHINYLSEANIPVFYDREKKAYRLNTISFPCFSYFSTSDAALILTALENIKRSVNAEYANDIDRIINRILTECSVPFENFLSLIGSKILSTFPGDDLSDSISSILLQVASGSSSPIRVTYTNEKSGTTMISLKNPILEFKHCWQVVSEESGTQPVDLAKIRRISIQ